MTLEEELKEKYALNTYQLNEIHLGVEAGVDVSIYAKPEFDEHQMKEISLGLVTGVDVNEYTDHNLSYKKMEEIRLELEKSTPKYKDIGEPTCEQIKWCRHNALPILIKLPDNELWKCMKDAYNKAHKDLNDEEL